MEHPKTYQALALSESGLSCFDERDFRFTVMHDFGAKQASDIVPFVNIRPRWGHFTFNPWHVLSRELGIEKDESAPVIFTWSNGKLTGHFALRNRKVKKLDLAYVHFFKRDINAQTCGLKNDGSVYIVEPRGVREFRRGTNFSYWDICWMDRPRIRIRYFVQRLNWQTIKNKVAHRRRKRVDDLVYWPDC